MFTAMIKTVAAIRAHPTSNLAWSSGTQGVKQNKA